MSLFGGCSLYFPQWERKIIWQVYYGGRIIHFLRASFPSIPELWYLPDEVMPSHPELQVQKSQSSNPTPRSPSPSPFQNPNLRTQSFHPRNLLHFPNHIHPSNTTIIHQSLKPVHLPSSYDTATSNPETPWLWNRDTGFATEKQLRESRLSVAQALLKQYRGEINFSPGE